MHAFKAGKNRRRAGGVSALALGGLACSARGLTPPTRHGIRRGGITLLEVLVSIGVLSVGMLGAASMLPLATYYSQEASKFDRAGTLGAQAYHDLQIRGYLSPKKWIDPTGAFTYTNQSVVMIDPLAMTYAAGSYASTPATVALTPVYFPALPSNNPNPPVAGAPIIFRANVDATNSWPDAAPLQSAAPTAMPYGMADRIFRATDDMIFDVPGRADLRPQTPTGSLSADYSGDYSWAVTVSHTAADIFNAPNMQRLQCSIIVYYKRDLNLNPGDWPGPPAEQKPPPERIVYADFLQAPVNGVPFHSGGSLLLRNIDTTSTSQTNWLDNLKPNTYVMLSANFVDTVATGGTFPRIGWYRIVSVDGGVQTNGNTVTRMITVDGADWVPQTTTYVNPGTGAISTPTLWIDADGGGAPTVFCTIAEGAVAVYDDVITLDNSLLRD